MVFTLYICFLAARGRGRGGPAVRGRGTAPWQAQPGGGTGPAGRGRAQ